MTCNEPLEAAAGVIVRSVGDIAHLVELLEAAGQMRLAGAIRAHLDTRPQLGVGTIAVTVVRR